MSDNYEKFPVNDIIIHRNASDLYVYTRGTGI